MLGSDAKVTFVLFYNVQLLVHNFVTEITELVRIPFLLKIAIFSDIWIENEKT